MKDIVGFVALLRRYTRPYWKAMLLLLLTSYVATALTGVLPLLMAPVLDLALGRSPGGPGGAPTGWWGINLGNLGALVAGWIGLSPTRGLAGSLRPAGF